MSQRNESEARRGSLSLKPTVMGWSGLLKIAQVENSLKGTCPGQKLSLVTAPIIR